LGSVIPCRPQKQGPVIERTSAGQDEDDPEHFSTISQVFAAARQTVVDDLNESEGHEAVEPVQVSATSQVPAAARQTDEEDWNESAGQEEDEPEQVSATSQSPADALQTDDDWNESAGQEEDEPEQVSATSQSPADARQTEVEKVQVEVQQSPPSQASDPSMIAFPQIEEGGVRTSGAYWLVKAHPKISCLSHEPPVAAVNPIKTLGTPRMATKSMVALTNASVGRSSVWATRTSRL